MEKYRREIEMEGASGGGERLQLDDEETEASVRSAKKKEEREKIKLLKQFDALASQFEKSQSIIQNQPKHETAGSLKKKTKKKKEKTLGAKLRLKEKKKWVGLLPFYLTITN